MVGRFWWQGCFQMGEEQDCRGGRGLQALTLELSQNFTFVVLLIIPNDSTATRLFTVSSAGSRGIYVKNVVRKGRGANANESWPFWLTKYVNSPNSQLQNIVCFKEFFQVSKISASPAQYGLKILWIFCDFWQIKATKCFYCLCFVIVDAKARQEFPRTWKLRIILEYISLFVTSGMIWRWKGKGYVCILICQQALGGKNRINLFWSVDHWPYFINRPRLTKNEPF